MYVCCECGNIFEEPKKCYGELLEYFGDRCRESYIGSPCCSGSYIEAFNCELCGEYIAEDFYKDEDGNRYCESHFTFMQLGDE